MCRLLETIKIDHNDYNLHYHNLRFNQSRKDLFKNENWLDLNSFIQVPAEFQKSIVKCRVIYQEDIMDVQFSFYQRRMIKSLKLVYTDAIDYAYKYEDRRCLNHLLNQKGNFDDVLIIRDQKITDTSFTNIAFYDEKKWFTPLSPLLKGTKREQLIHEKKIIPADLSIKDLYTFKTAILFNSMIDLEDRVIIDMENIK